MPKKITKDTKLKVGITVNSEQDKLPSVWSSGAWQNVIFLYYLLQESHRLSSVRFLNHAVKPSKTLEVVQGTNLPLHTFDELKDDLDVLIIMGIQLSQEMVDHFREKGTKVICFHVGNHYIITLENILFDLHQRGGGEFDGCTMDGVWTLPHHEKTCRSFFETTLNAPVTSMPYLWNALFIEHMVLKNNLGGKFGYQPKSSEYKQKIVIFEPNINIVKSSIYPMLISELAYREKPELIGGIHVTNTAKFHRQTAFNKFAFTLDITKKGIASYDDRYDTPSFMSFYGDIVLSHQWENGLNNLYFDLLYGNYPLVHNSIFLKDIGYYYEEFDAKGGAKQLIKALSKHNHEDYKKKCKKELDKVDIYNSENIKAYEDGLFALFK